MIINHNFCIKLVPLVIFIYGARSHIHQIPDEFNISIFTMKVQSVCYSKNLVLPTKLHGARTQKATILIYNLQIIASIYL